MRPGDERVGPSPDPAPLTGASTDVPRASARPSPAPTTPRADGAAGTSDTARTASAVPPLHVPGDLPEVPDSVREAALSAPGHWLGVTDPEWPGDRPPPNWAVVGEWRADEKGVIREYRANPAYRPSARVLGWPEPTDPVDAAAQRAATGYGSPDEALAALAEAEVSVVRGTDGRPLTAAGADGAPVVLAFTSPTHQFMSPTLIHDTLPAGELARRLRGSGAVLMVNAAAAAPLVVPVDSLPDPTPVPETATTEGRVAQDAADRSEQTVDRAAEPESGGPTMSSGATGSPGQATWPQTAGRTP